ncbi:MAG: SIMPL domain-containing protein [Balneolaceae bacterium]|nr:SIMPL domain-containing protein [Balneolaceae bacterium]
MRSENGVIPAAGILAGAIIIGVIIFSYTWHSNYQLDQTISVTGSATQTFTSDIGYLRARIEASGSTAQQAYQNLEQQKPAVINFFSENGFQRNEIIFSTFNSYSREDYDQNGRPTGRVISWTYSQQVEVKSNDVQKIKALSLEMGSLVQQGINVQVESPEYYYSGLDSLKISIQSRAAENAMVRAQKISEATDQELGNMTSARMGVLQITPINSNQVSGMGINDASSIEKEITGVVSATFQIE